MKSKVHIRKVHRYDLKEIESFVRESIDLYSGSTPLFQAGQKVMLKPNLLRGFAPERCVTTHPCVVEAVIRVLRDYSVGDIDISDSPALGSLASVAKNAGYEPLIQRYGVRIQPLSNPVPLQTEDNIAQLKIAGNIREYDHIINLPKFKSHCQMTLTLAIKNLFGLVIGKRKPVLHCLVQNDKVKFGRMLIDIARHVNPGLTIVDGIEAMQGNGPINGSPYPLGILAAAQDMTSLDRILAEIVQVPLETVFALKAAEQKNYGNLQLEQIELSGANDLEALKVTGFKSVDQPMDITFNPIRVIKSLIKQFYEIGIKEKLAG